MSGRWCATRLAPTTTSILFIDYDPESRFNKDGPAAP